MTPAQAQAAVGAKKGSVTANMPNVHQVAVPNPEETLRERKEGSIVKTSLEKSSHEGKETDGDGRQMPLPVEKAVQELTSLVESKQAYENMNAKQRTTLKQIAAESGENGTDVIKSAVNTSNEFKVQTFRNSKLSSEKQGGVGQT